MTLRDTEADRRARRLSEALRANLRRRKAQARGRAVAEADPVAPPAPGAQEPGPLDPLARRAGDPTPPCAPDAGPADPRSGAPDPSATDPSAPGA